MLSKTRGIVLHSIAYNDKYSIVHLYTESFGRASYLVSRSRGRKSTVSHALFSPFSVLDMEVDHKNNRDIHRIKEVRSHFPTSNLSCDPIKNIVTLFLSEVVFRIVRETEPDEALFNFLLYAVQELESTQKSVANFHLVFLLHLLHHQGVFPSIESYNEEAYFDLLNGEFIDSIPMHKHYLNQHESTVFAQLLRINFENMHAFDFARTERVSIIQNMLAYYRLHLPPFAEIKSIAIMQSLFD